MSAEDTAATNEREKLIAVLVDLNVGGWRQESGHDCDGTDEVCTVRCPVAVQVEVSLDEIADAALAATQRPDDREATLRARIEGVLAEHWDWKAGRSLHAAITAALAATDGSPS